jgi:hypothetical protein
MHLTSGEKQIARDMFKGLLLFLSRSQSRIPAEAESRPTYL